MYRKLYIVVALTLFLAHPAYALSPAPPPVPLEEKSVSEIVEHFAKQYNVSAKQMLNTMQCESSMDKDAVGDHGQSFGLSQIYLPAHKNITKAQATNAVFATEYMASEFQKGNQSEWTCARILKYDRS